MSEQPSYESPKVAPHFGSIDDYLSDLAEAQDAYGANPSSKNFDDMHAAQDALNRHFPSHKPKPPPGSDSAVALSCKCPRMDNGHGKGYMGIAGVCFTREDCPIHGKEKD